MMTHYVEETDPEMREASNRTYRRILASLPSEVARRYGYGHEEPPQGSEEQQLQQAIAARDWQRVAELSALLSCRQKETG